MIQYSGKKNALILNTFYSASNIYHAFECVESREEVRAHSVLCVPARAQRMETRSCANGADTATSYYERNSSDGQQWTMASSNGNRTPCSSVLPLPVVGVVPETPQTRASAPALLTPATETTMTQTESEQAQQQPVLPDDVWATLFCFLDYQSLFQCSVINKHFLYSVVLLVKELILDRPEQLHACAARRFKGVNKITITCLVRLLPGAAPVRLLVYDARSNREICNHTCERLVPFLTSFSNVKKVLLRGIN